MNDTWDFFNNIAEFIKVFILPIATWVVYTLVQQGKQIIVLEQKVNESLNARLQRVEARVSNVEEKLEEIAENVVECKVSSAGINSKLDVLVSKTEGKKD